MTALSTRQRQIIALVAAGHTNPSIARQLRLSQYTVKSHLDVIFERLGAHGRAHAVALAILVSDVQAGMPESEIAEWLAGVRGEHKHDPSRRGILAARAASLWKQYGMHFAGQCLGPGHHGARCPAQVDVLTFFEVCTVCSPDGPCLGHDRWCRRHAELAQQGDLAMIGDDPFAVTVRPISKIAQLTPIEEPAF